MTKDHYVSQTYLKNFTNEEGKLIPHYKNKKPNNKMPIIGKPKPTQSVCYGNNHNTNHLLDDPRTVEEWIKIPESNWNDNLELLKNKKRNLKSDMHKLITYLKNFTPKGLTKHEEDLKNSVLPPYTDIFKDPEYNKYLNPKGRSLIDSVNNDTIRRDILQECIVAHPSQIFMNGKPENSKMGLETQSAMIINCRWIVIPSKKEHFVTSDHPFCPLQDLGLYNELVYYIPLSHDMALVLMADKTNQEKIARGEYEDVPQGQLIFAPDASPKVVNMFNMFSVLNADQAVYHHEPSTFIEDIIKDPNKYRDETGNTFKKWWSDYSKYTRPRPLYTRGTPLVLHVLPSPVSRQSHPLWLPLFRLFLE